MFDVPEVARNVFNFVARSKRIRSVIKGLIMNRYLRLIGNCVVAALVIVGGADAQDTNLNGSSSDTVAVDCCDTCDGSPLFRKCHTYQFYVQSDALFLRRNNGMASQPIVLADNSGATLLSTGDIDFSTAVGPSLLIGKTLCDCYAGEISYWGFNGWQESNQVSQFNNLDIPGPLVAVADDFDNADTIIARTASRINNAEINLVRSYGSLSLLGGFRYFNFEDRFNLTSIDNDGDVSNYRVKASNDLFGAQLGSRYTANWCKWGLVIAGKAGVYGNDARQQQTVMDNGNTFLLRDASASHAKTSFIGETNLLLTRQLSSRLSLRGGYMCVWASDLAMAPSQLDFTDLATSGTIIATSDNLFLHGAIAGAQFNW